MKVDGMKNILDGKVLLGALVTALVLMCITLVILWLRPAVSQTGLVPASAAMTVIAPSTSTPVGVVPDSTRVPPTPQSTPTLLPGSFGKGAFVQITGTEGQGLRLRADPGLAAAQLFLGFDSEVYEVVDGPIQADGYTWWKLTAPYDAARTGWAVQDYLTVIQSP